MDTREISSEERLWFQFLNYSEKLVHYLILRANALTDHIHGQARIDELILGAIDPTKFWLMNLYLLNAILNSKIAFLQSQ